jgi:hypothetical protein
VCEYDVTKQEVFEKRMCADGAIRDTEDSKQGETTADFVCAQILFVGAVDQDTEGDKRGGSEHYDFFFVQAARSVSIVILRT